MRRTTVITTVMALAVASCGSSPQDSIAPQGPSHQRQSLADEIARPEPTPTQVDEEPSIDVAELEDDLAGLQKTLEATVAERDLLRARIAGIEAAKRSLSEELLGHEETLSLVQYLEGLVAFYRGLVAREVIPTLSTPDDEPFAGACPMPEPLAADLALDDWVIDLHEAAEGIASGVNRFESAFLATDRSLAAWIYEEPVRSAALRLIAHEQAAAAAIEAAWATEYAPVLPLEDYPRGKFEERIFPALLTGESLGVAEEPVPGPPTSTPCGWGSSLVDVVDTIVDAMEEASRKAS